jgi:hypothetical protein
MDGPLQAEALDVALILHEPGHESDDRIAGAAALTIKRPVLDPSVLRPARVAEPETALAAGTTQVLDVLVSQRFLSGTGWPTG